MAFLVGGANSATSGAFDISNSLRLNDDDSPKLARTPSTAGSRRIFSISFWQKKGSINHDSDNIIAISGSDDATNFEVANHSTEAFQIGLYNVNMIRTTRLFRDAAAWTHFFFFIDTTNATESNRFQLYINGVQETSFSDTNIPSQNADLGLGRDVATNFFGSLDAYISDFYYIDGIKKAHTDFGEFDEDSGIWKPIEYDGSYGDEGIHLEFKQTGTSADASGIGADTSGNTNHLTVTNLTATDITTDTPTNNFCTLNPLLANTQIGFSEGNCKISSVPASDTNYLGAWSSIGVTKGKWYAEFKIESAIYSSLGTDATTLIGVGSGNYKAGNENHNVAIGGYAHWWLDHTDKRVVADGDVDATGIATIAQNEIVGCMLNADEGKVWFQQNGTTRGASGGYPFNATVSSGQGFQHFIPVVREASGSIYGIINCNFGNPAFAISSSNADANGYGNFEYAVPSGYYALCTKNLAEYG